VWRGPVVAGAVGPVGIEVPRDRAGARCLCRRRCWCCRG